MKKEKYIYLGVIILIVLVVSTSYFSYAMFSDRIEKHGKLNIVAGTLDYKIESSDLVNDKITVSANTVKEIKINVTSLNTIDSKYELYYTMDKNDSNIEVGYSNSTKDSVLGTISAQSTKEITVIIRNDSEDDISITFNVMGGFINNELVLTNGNSLNQSIGNYATYAIGDTITLVDGSKWHVLEYSSSGSEYVTLLSDYNLNSDGSYNTECGININSSDICSSMAFYATSSMNDYSNSDIADFIQTKYISSLSNLPGTKDVGLPTAYQIAIADGKTFVDSSLSISSDWLSTTTYWTNTPNNSTDGSVWIMYGSYKSLASCGSVDATLAGVRPVITTLKSNIITNE